MNNKKYLIIGALILLGLTFEAGRFSKPAKTVTVTKEVVKTVAEAATQKIVYKEHIVYKDGTVKDIEKTDDSTSTKTATVSDKSSKNVVTNSSGLTLSALAIVDSSSITGHRDYGIHVTKRVFSNVVVGAMATTDKKIGVSIGLTF